LYSTSDSGWPKRSKSGTGSGRSSSAGGLRADDRVRASRLADVVEHPLDGSGVGDEGDDAPVRPTVGADRLAKDSNIRASSIAQI